MNALSNPVYSTPLYEPISKIRTTFDAIQVLRKTCLSYGFRYFSVLTIPAMVSESAQVMSHISVISSWPPELIADYDRLELGKNSPVLERLRKQITPLLFEVENIDSERDGAEQASAKELFTRFGVTMGVYFPVQDGRGQRFAVCFMGARKPLSATELPSLAMFATLLVDQLSQITANEDTAKLVLNARETEVLQWTAEGKTSAEIARITGLSEHTVNHYATIATQKLGCSNRTQAVVQAIRLGLFR
ncbi:DNA-binding HTH domain-containing protein [Hoeflea phototrophica DFL-43]|uniref:DNA-binding HTH domain-containing protein n=1 Tax=Hoeflea phototrophica (strain DSM 17068 / NCIMB 14078 / DFL-43) TaxID=411684 RepID=A9DE85_HOEPD|nr:LuxR family transcriptional regulator [Hoeflea phototrophica]EDQ31984.1 DNA-binding HTH domain-containing protein [Hoeflea phototrophica DFL-43]